MANIYSVSLDGNDAFSATDHADFKPTGAFTVGGWFKSASATTQRLVFQSFSYILTKYAGIRLYIETDHKLTFDTGKNTGNVDGTDVKFIHGSTTIDDGSWCWGVVTWNGTHLNLYVNGSPDADAVAWANAPAYNATNYVRVGCKSNDGSNAGFFTGNLDEIFLINGTAWDASTVTNYYKKFLTGATNLKAYYQLENNGNDSTAGAHTLTNIGSPTYQTDVPFVDVFVPKVIII